MQAGMQAHSGQPAHSGQQGLHRLTIESPGTSTIGHGCEGHKGNTTAITTTTTPPPFHYRQYGMHSGETNSPQLPVRLLTKLKACRCAQDASSINLKLKTFL